MTVVKPLGLRGLINPLGPIIVKQGEITAQTLIASQGGAAVGGAPSTTSFPITPDPNSLVVVIYQAFAESPTPGATTYTSGWTIESDGGPATFTEQQSQGAVAIVATEFSACIGCWIAPIGATVDTFHFTLSHPTVSSGSNGGLWLTGHAAYQLTGYDTND